MSKIKLLDDFMINQIAAGEVVERPLSVIKELTENSIDAGANSIVIEIKDGGTSYIRITDNGSGIPKDDVERAFFRHATSKIRNMDDLENVLTLGFRGEALSSIASVSQVEMITKTKDDETGIKIEIHGEELIKKEDIGSVNGTSIIVRNIFFNIPARRKFLKKPSTEGSMISEIVNKLALGNPFIAFKYINNGTVMLQTNGNGDLKTAIYQVYGKEIAKNLIEVKSRAGDFEIFGLIGKPEISRGNRKYENLFINGRYIKSEIVESAVEQVYRTRLMGGKFPLFVLNIKIPPDKIDVNVHPTKLEVRFQEEGFIFDSVVAAIEKAFKGENLIPQKSISDEKKNGNGNKLSDFIEERPFEIEKEQPILGGVGFEPETPEMSEIVESKYVKEARPVYKIGEEDYSERKKSYTFENLNEAEEQGKVGNHTKKEIDEIENITNIIEVNETEIKEKQEKQENKESEKKIKPFFYDYKIVGQIFSTYWIIEQNNCMYIIDQHAAHERILFEKFSNDLKSKEIVSQRLFEPIVLNVTAKESEVIKNNFELLNDFGFELEEFGDNIFAIRSLPYIFNKPENLSFFTEIVDKLENTNTSVKNIYDTKIDEIATISCKAAVKGNNKLSFQEAKKLLEDLLTLENPFTCPHGRPTIIEISKHEMEKKFKRIL